MSRTAGPLPGPLLRLVGLVGQAVVALIVVIVVAPVWLLPWPAALRLGRWYGYLGFLLYAPGRRTGQINLRQVYGEAMSRSDARWRTLEVFGSLAQAMAEGLQFARRFAGGTAGWDRIFDVEDPALVQRIRSDPRAKIFVTAHHGSWEMAMMAAAVQHGNGAAIMRGVDNPFVDALLRWARGSRTPFIDKHGGAAAALERLRQGTHVAMLLDENAGARGVWVDFFGRAASTHRTAALLAAQTGSPIIVGVAVRRPAGRYRYRVAMIEPGPASNHVALTTSRITTVLESWIREDPLQWRWIHWRWKTRPDRSEERYGRRELRACFEPRRAGRLAHGARRT